MAPKKLKFANKIRRLRFDAEEMTQQELAAKVGVTRQTIAAIEKSKYSPSLELAFLLAQVFDQEIGQVFWVEENLRSEP